MEDVELRTKCIALSNQCIEECKSTAILSKTLPNMKHCIDLCLRCAEECEFLISVCLSNSISNPEYYDKCSEACADCANECEKYDLLQCKRCAEICRKFQLTYIFQSYKTHQPITLAYQKTRS